MIRLLPALAFLLVFAPRATPAVEPLRLSASFDAPEPVFELIEFDVPEGVVEFEVRRSYDSSQNVLDFGLIGPEGARGWGGGNREPAVLGLASASRSYRPGPVAGRWQAVVGKALLRDAPTTWTMDVVFRTEPMLAPHPDRAPFEGKAVLSTERRWYAGDLHTHSRESGDARPTFDEMAAFAKSRGLDFIAVSDHNTASHVDLIERTQARHDDLLFVPSVEYTTYAGHANALGATAYVSHLLGVDTTLDEAVDAFERQGALFGINHPVLDLGDLCLGCAWRQTLAPERVQTVEIGTGAYTVTGRVFGEAALEFWDDLLDEGSRAAPVGGSDDHQAGKDESMFASPIGSPTTLVFADGLSTASIVRAVGEGRTVVKLEGPDDPMVEFTLDEALIGDEVGFLPEQTRTLRATVTGAEGQMLRFVVDGRPGDEVIVDGDPFVYELSLKRPSALSRIRAEVVVDGAPRTVTGHVWMVPQEPEGGCGCGGASSVAFAAVGLLALVRRRRQRP